MKDFRNRIKKLEAALIKKPHGEYLGVFFAIMAADQDFDEAPALSDFAPETALEMQAYAQRSESGKNGELLNCVIKSAKKVIDRG